MTTPDIDALAKRVAPLTRDDLLILLVEECGEVIQAATKCLRFGYERDQPGYGINCEVLAREIGDFIGVVDALEPDRVIVEKFARAKIAKAKRYKAELGAELALTTAPRDAGERLTEEEQEVVITLRDLIDVGERRGDPYIKRVPILLAIIARLTQKEPNNG